MKNKGFTLIELLVVTAIMAMLTTMTLSNFNSGRKQRAVKLSADALVSVLRQAQGYTLTGRTIPSDAVLDYDSGDHTCTGSSKSIADYRLVVSNVTNKYYLKASDNCGNIYIINTFTLVQNTQIKSGGITMDSAGSSQIQIKFIPPFSRMSAATTTTNPSNFYTFNTISMTVEYNDGSKSATVSIDGVSGRIGQ